jgi:hypothetical protein
MKAWAENRKYIACMDGLDCSFKVILEDSEGKAQYNYNNQ